MRRQPQRFAAQAVPVGRFIPAPVGGWNTRDPLLSMKKDEAIILDNLFPRVADVVARSEAATFATLPTDIVATPHDIETLMSYSPPSGAQKLFAVDNTGIFDVTAGGAIAASSHTLTEAACRFLNFTTPGGSFLWVCNGTNNCVHYNGTTWAEPTLTGITSAAVTNVSAFKNRLILLVNSSLSFYYLGVNSIAGAATEFPLGSIFNKGGYLVATGTWSLDAGEGLDDYFVAITSEGEVALYKGTDPASASTFALVGVYPLARPLGRRCLLPLGGDLLALTVGGVFPLSHLLTAEEQRTSAALNDKVLPTWLSAVRGKATLPGWQGILFPEQSMLLLNVPLRNGLDPNVISSYQFVMNTETKKWARFTGLHATCWEYHNGYLYFAAHNLVKKTGDVTVHGVEEISFRWKSSFQTYGYAGLKSIPLFRPIYQAIGEVPMTYGIDSDFDTSFLSSSSTTTSGDEARYDTGVFDQSVWGGSAMKANWLTVGHKPGTALSFRLRFFGSGDSIVLNAVELLVKRGGFL